MQDPPVCVACGCCPRGLGRATPTYHPFRFPIGLDHYRKLPCAPPRELGVDHAWLPVTHLGGPHKTLRRRRRMRRLIERDA